MELFEYKVIDVSVKKAQEEMNRWAREGWRVIAVSPNIAMGYGLVITFEKQAFSHDVPSGGFGA